MRGERLPLTCGGLSLLAPVHLQRLLRRGKYLSVYPQASLQRDVTPDGLASVLLPAGKLANILSHGFRTLVELKNGLYTVQARALVKSKANTSLGKSWRGFPLVLKTLSHKSFCLSILFGLFLKFFVVLVFLTVLVCTAPMQAVDFHRNAVRRPLW